MDQFFCVRCGKLIDIGLASMLFRTGYFRVEYHLGSCVPCVRAEENRVPPISVKFT
jgi:hypothetical protein